MPGQIQLTRRSRSIKARESEAGSAASGLAAWSDSVGGRARRPIPRSLPVSPFSAILSSDPFFSRLLLVALVSVVVMGSPAKAAASLGSCPIAISALVAC